jgi:hypothetical protein
MKGRYNEHGRCSQWGWDGRTWGYRPCQEAKEYATRYLSFEPSNSFKYRQDTWPYTTHFTACSPNGAFSSSFSPGVVIHSYLYSISTLRFPPNSCSRETSIRHVSSTSPAKLIQETIGRLKTKSFEQWLPLTFIRRTTNARSFARRELALASPT